MPAKRHRAPASHRGDETQRLPGDSAAPGAAPCVAPSSTSSTAAAAHSASDRRPHHLSSRLRRPWGSTTTTSTAVGTTLRTSGITPNTLTTTGSKGVAATAGSAAATSPSSAAAQQHRVAEPASDAVATSRTRRDPLPLLSTRVSGSGRTNGCTSRAVVPVQGRGVGAGRNAARRGKSGARIAAARSTVSASRKRPRSKSNASSSNPIDISAEEEEEVDEGEEVDGGSNSINSISSSPESTTQGFEARPEVTQLTSSSSSSSSSRSLSPSPVVTERQVWKTGGGNPFKPGDAAVHSSAGTAGVQVSSGPVTKDNDGTSPAVCAASPPTTSAAPSTGTTRDDSVTPAKGMSAAAAAAAAAAASALMHDTAASTAGSKVLFSDHEDEEEEGVVGGGGSACGADRRRGRLLAAPAAEEMRVLGEFSENAFVTPTRPAAAPPLSGTLTESGNAVRRLLRVAGRTGAEDDHEEEEEEEEEELLCKPRGVPGSSVRPTGGPGDNNGEARQRRAASLSEHYTAHHRGEGTPEPLPDSGHTATAATAAAAADTAGTFAETLMVQDLPFLADEGGDSVGPRAAAAAQYVSQEVEGMLLGEGFVSPPVNRVTATPRQAAHDASTAAPGFAQEAVQMHDPRRELPMDGENLLSTTSIVTPPPPPTPESSHAPAHGAAPVERSLDDTHGTTARANAASTTVPSCPAPGSLPSTQDDGLWNGEEEEGEAAEEDRPVARAATTAVAVADAAALTPRRDTPSEEGGDGLNTPLAPRLVDDEADAAAAAAAAVWLSAAESAETVPIDPFLYTPPQLKRASQMGQGGAATAKAEEEEGDSGVSTRTRIAPARLGRGGAAAQGHDSNTRGGLNSSSRATPHSSQPQPPPITHPHEQAPVSADSPGVVVTGADVDAGLLVAGLRVEGRWGRQWFPATISEAPRNGFVRIAWEEDGSLLHVRLREVRVRLADGDATRNATPVTPVTSHNGVPPALEIGATPAGGQHNDRVLTATQLVALMEEEDEGDSRHEPVPPHLPTSPSAAVMSHRAATPAQPTAATGADGTRHGNRGGEAEEDGEEKEGPLDPSCEGGVPGVETPATDAPEAPLRLRRARSALRATGSRSASRSPAPPLSLPPGEVHPSLLCVVLPQSARRELLQGDAASLFRPQPPSSLTSSAHSVVRPARHTGPATELQRSTELQRLLHFLSSTGATVVDSLAQADNMAAQIGERLDAPADAHEEPAELPTPDARAATSTTTSQASPAPTGGNANKRKAAGRVPLPRRSSAHTGGAAAMSVARASAPRYFIFLVASSSFSPTGEAAADALGEVTLAHALGVSAVHVSWLWSITPGTPHVRLPTAHSEVHSAALPSAAGGATERAEREKAVGAVGRPSTASSPALDASSPPRLEPFAVRDRVLNGREVLFLERDDRMEMWLNAAGAAVRAEPTPAPAAAAAAYARQTRASVLAVAGPANGGGDASTPVTGTTGGGGGGGAAAGKVCRRSESPARALLPKVPRVEKVPDYVHVPLDRPAPEVVDLERLGGVPLLTLAWLADSIEQHYRRHCVAGGSSTADTAAQAKVHPPAVLAEVWPTLPHSFAQHQRERSVKQSATSPQPQSLLHCPSPRTEPPVQESEQPRPVASVLSTDAATAVPSLEVTTSLPRGEGDHTVAAPSTAGVAPRTEGNQADGKTATDTSTLDERQRVMGNEPREVDETTGSATALANAEVAQEPARTPAAVVVAMHGTTHSALEEARACTAHPAILEGEDYYFIVSGPRSSPPPPQQQQHQTLSQQGGTPMLRCPAPVVPTRTIELGHVVSLQRNPAASGPLSPTTCCCHAVLQLYKIKHALMHENPHTGEWVRETTVYRAQLWATVPGAALLFDTPVYVIDTAERKHVYMLETPPGNAEEPHARTPASWTPNRVSSSRDAPAYRHGGHLDGAPLTAPVQYGLQGAASQTGEPGTRMLENSTPISPDNRHQLDQAHADGTNRVPSVVARFAVVRAAQISRGRDTPSRLESEGPHNGTVTGTEASLLTPNAPRSAAPAPHVNITSLPPTSDLAERHDAPTRSSIHGASPGATAAAAGPALPDGTSPPATAHQPSRFAIPQRSVTTTAGAATSPLGTSDSLQELLVQVGAGTVLLRRNCLISFYAGRSVSVSDRASRRGSISSARGGSVQSAPLPPRRDNTTGGAVHEDGANSDVASDASEECVVEMPLVGKVDRLRVMENDVVDIVVQTEQSNGIFSGPKIHRITPDMIVDVFPQGTSDR